MKQEARAALLFGLVTGRSGTNYLVTKITRAGLEAVVVDFIVDGGPEKVLLPNDAFITFANVDSVHSKYPVRLGRLIKKAMDEWTTEEINY